MGMDMPAGNLNEGVNTILESLKKIQEIHKSKSNLYFTSVMMTSKSAELVNVFSGASETIRNEAKQTLTQLDPANASKYAKLN
jgi:hypothetical protein